VSCKLILVGRPLNSWKSRSHLENSVWVKH